MNGIIQPIPRCVVIATRTNPNAFHPWTRRLQIRAWNSAQEVEQPSPASELATEVVSAHLFGLFRNLRLQENARALAYSVQARTGLMRDIEAGATRDIFGQTRQRADLERERVVSKGADGQSRAFFEMATEIGAISVEMSTATLSLASRISSSLDYDESLEAIADADRQLDEWVTSQGKIEETEALMSSGIRVRFPSTFFERRIA